MSYKSDAASLSALCNAILDRKYQITVLSEGDRLCQPTKSFLTVSVAVHSVTDDCVLLLIDATGKRCGFFRVLLQDDPDCLIVDHSDNVLCNAIYSDWSKIADLPSTSTSPIP